MSARLVRFADQPVTPWANGQGETVELARVAAPSADGFDWRVSIATVGSSAWFSVLPGVDRALMALAEDGLRVEVDGEVSRLRRLDSILFGGEDAVRAVDVTVPGRDLNLMVRRGLGEPWIEPLAVEGPTVAPEGVLALVVLEGRVTWRGIPLAVGDAVLPDGRRRAPVTVRGSGVVAVVETHH